MQCFDRNKICVMNNTRVTFSTSVFTTSKCPPAAARMSDVNPVSDMTLGSALHNVCTELNRSPKMAETKNGRLVLLLQNPYNGRAK